MSLAVFLIGNNNSDFIASSVLQSIFSVSMGIMC